MVKDKESLSLHMFREFLGKKVKIVIEAEGICIAIIHRLEDDDDKLVLAAGYSSHSDEQIDKAVYFRERFFKHIIIR